MEAQRDGAVKNVVHLRAAGAFSRIGVSSSINSVPELGPCPLGAVMNNRRFVCRNGAPGGCVSW